MISSDFIDNNSTFDEKELINSKGKTSQSYKVKKNGRLYFMKQLLPELYQNHSNRVLFYKEYELGHSIQSEHVVKYERICEDEQGLYIIMEYVCGSTLEEKLTDDKGYFADERNLWKFMLQLLEGLRAFHDKGIAYIDISPNNIMLTQVGNNVKIVDLGFCFSNAYNDSLGTTAGFTAPELGNCNNSDIDERTDIYAVGCLMKYIQAKSGTKYSGKFYSIMERCLNKEKSKRYRTIDEMKNAIRRRRPKHWIMGWMALITALTLLLCIHRYTTLSNTDIIETTSVRGVNYRILSNEDCTCEITGGDGEKGNIYITAKVNIGGKEYRTTSIANHAFQKKKLASLYIPEGVEHIGHSAFSHCEPIITISLPSSIKEFGGAFNNMKKLKRIKFPNGMKTISSGAFGACDELEQIYIPEGVERLSLDAFALCSSLKEVSLPSTLKVIERGVFWRCTSLEEITIPASVEEIGDYAFFDCSNLKHIYLYPTTPPAIAAILNYIDINVHVPAASLKAYQKHPNWRDYNLIGDLEEVTEE